MKKILKTALISALLLCRPMAFAAEPDSENYRKGVEALNNRQYMTAVDYFILTTEEFPRNGYIYSKISDVAYNVDKTFDAIDFSLNALDYFEADDSAAIAETYLRLAMISTYNGDQYRDLLQQPIVYYDSAVAANPGDYRTWLKRGVYLDIYERQYDRACDDFRKAIELQPDEVEPYTRLAQSLYSNQNKIDEAIEVYKSSCSTLTDFPYHHTALAQLLIEKGQYDEAAEIMLKGIDMANETIPWYNVLSDFPPKQREYLTSEIKNRLARHPERTFYNDYLDALK